jgi:hypothetical protein
MDAALEKTYRLSGFGCCFSGAALGHVHCFLFPK